MSRISVVIPNWNGRHFLDACLRSLAGQQDVDLEVIVVDNGSKDGSVQYLRQEYGWVSVIAMPSNRGFSAAVNAGIDAASEPYVFVLNNDTELDPHCIHALLVALERDPGIGAAGPKILDFKDRALVGGIGDGYTLSGIPSSIGFMERDQGQFEEPLEIFSPSGCAALYRQSALAKVGTFDEDFFAYFEDVDLGFRLRMAGYRCVYEPRALIYHIGSGSTGGGTNPFKVRQMAQNMIGLALKNLPLSILLRVIPVWALVQMLLMSRLLFIHSNDKLGHLRAYGAGLMGAIRMLPRMLARRRQNLARSHLSSGELLTLIQRSEAMILHSLMRARGAKWRFAPFVRFYLRLFSGGAR